MIELLKIYKKQHPLSLRIVLIIVACSGLFATLVAATQLYSRYHSDQEILAQRLADAESAFLEDINEALWRLDEPLIRQNIEGIQRLPFIVRVQLITEQKRVYSVGQQVESRWVKERTYDVVRSTGEKTIRLGQLKVWVDERSIIQNVKEQALETLVLQALKTAIVSALILIILHFMLFRHLRSLHRVATSLSANNLSLPFWLDRPDHAPDELDHVCKALDDMRLRLEKGVDEIQFMQTEMRRIYLAADSSNSAVAIFSVEEGNCLYRNNGFQHFFGEADHLFKLICLLDPDVEFTQWLLQLKQNGSWQHELFWHDGQQPRWLSARCLFYMDNAEELVMLTASDISELREAHERERHLMENDLLTGLPNVQSGLQEANNLLQQAEQQSLRLAVMAFSLKSFKAVIESFGTRYADQLVLRVSETLSSFIPEDALLARSADNQFICAMVLHQNGDDYLLALLEQLRSLLSQPLKLKGQIVDCGFYAGVSLFPVDGINIEQLHQRALSALHRAYTETPRNRYYFYDNSMEGLASRRLKIAALLNTGQMLEELELHYQPLVCTKSGETVGCEALARWQNDELGFIPPPEFISVAEKNGQIIELGELILQRACLQLKEWQKIEPQLQMSVNISPLQVMDTDFISVIKNALQLSGISPGSLKLEVTEQLMLQSNNDVLNKLNAIKQLGVQLVIDDFGVGYASLNYLCGYPFEVLKIDQSFIRNITQEESLYTLTATITELAHSLGLKVVAEGVETEEIAMLLQQMGCDLMQGYLFSRPLPADAFLERLKGQGQS